MSKLFRILAASSSPVCLSLKKEKRKKKTLCQSLIVIMVEMLGDNLDVALIIKYYFSVRGAVRWAKNVTYLSDVLSYHIQQIIWAMGRWL